ncbi:MFS domain-containing protein [Tenacibaculum sp. 190524A02b]|uniref:MFS domain-containing protein n=1 Tax=Tenacibaculum vairaonense TaxID=3137860 RepID=A0ABP1FJY4_9FLAO
MLLTKYITLKKQSPLFTGALRASGVMAFAGLGDALLYPVLPIYGKELGFSAFVVGMLLSINRFIRILANTYVANLVIRIGMRNMLLITSSIAVITTLMYGVKLGLIAFLIARIFWGLSYSGLKIATLNYAAKTKNKSGLAFGLAQSIKSIGALFILWFGPTVIKELGVENGFFLVAGISLFGVLLAYLLPNITSEKVLEKVKSSVTFYPNSMNFLVLILSIAIDGILVVTLAHLLSSTSFTSSELLTLVAFYLLLKRLFVILFSIIGGMLTLHYPPEKLFTIAVLGCLTSLFLISVEVTILGIILAFLCNTIVVTFSPLVAIKQQENTLQAISSVSTWWDLGAAIGALVGIYAIETLGTNYLFLSLFIIATILFINYIIQHAKSNSTTI